MAQRAGGAGGFVGGVRAVKKELQRVKSFSVAHDFKLAAQLVQDVVQHGLRPFPLKQTFRRDAVHRFQQIKILSLLAVKGEDPGRAAAFLRGRSLAFVRKKIAQRFEKKRAKAAAIRFDLGHHIAPDQKGEKVLGQILRFLRAAAPPAE